MESYERSSHFIKNYSSIMEVPRLWSILEIRRPEYPTEFRFEALQGELRRTGREESVPGKEEHETGKRVARSGRAAERSSGDVQRRAGREREAEQHNRRTLGGRVQSSGERKKESVPGR